MSLPEFALERFFARHEFSVPHLLCASDCESLSVGELLALEPGAAQALEELRLGYSESPGSAELRAAIAALYTTIAPGEVLAHHGAQEAILNFCRGALEPGEHVIVQTPCYQSLAEAPRMRGCRVTAWPSREEQGWRPSLDEVEALIQPGTRAIVINQPHNPTGGLLRRAELDALIDLCRRRDLLLLSDEVYRGLEFDVADRLPMACDLYERAVSIGVMSKSFGLAGLRVGWVATHDRCVLTGMAAAKDWTTICNGAVSELLAAVALRHAPALVERNRELVSGNLRLLDDLIARHGDRLAWTRPTAGPVAFPRWLGAGDAEDMAAALREQAGVLVAPGGLFGDHPRHLRLGFGRADLAETLTRFDAWLGDACG